MRHRNDTDQPLVVATDPPVLVEAGGEVDTPDHVAGLTCLDQPCPPNAIQAVEPANADQSVESVATESAPKASRRRTADTAEEA